MSIDNPIIMFLLATLVLCGCYAVFEVLCHGIMYVRLWWLERAINKEIKRRREFQNKYPRQN